MKKINIAINGLGRIGKCITRAVYEYEEYRSKFNIKKINSPSSNEVNAHLLKYDSIHGISKFNIESISEESVKIENDLIHFSHDKNIEHTKWDGVDCVMECTGLFLTEDKVQNHLNNGAKKVIISAPSKTKTTPVVLYGVNHEDFRKTTNNILSVGSCTTNAVATVLNILNSSFTINSCFVSTVHSATLDQRILDSSHKDLRRARSCFNSIIPTSTGATKTIEKIIPSLAGKMDGCALRIPSQNVSLAEIILNIEESVDVDLVHSIIQSNIEKDDVISKVLEISNKELVSVDYVHTTKSGIIDAKMTKVVNKNMIKISCWYDNEWAFACRMLDVCSYVS